MAAPDAALIYATEPVWGALFAFLLLHEQFGTNTYLGAALILAASVFGEARDKKEEAPPQI